MCRIKHMTLLTRGRRRRFPVRFPVPFPRGSGTAATHSVKPRAPSGKATAASPSWSGQEPARAVRSFERSPLRGAAWPGRQRARAVIGGRAVGRGSLGWDCFSRSLGRPALHQQPRTRWTGDPDQGLRPKSSTRSPSTWTRRRRGAPSSRVWRPAAGTRRRSPCGCWSMAVADRRRHHRCGRRTQLAPPDPAGRRAHMSRARSWLHASRSRPERGTVSCAARPATSTATCCRCSSRTCWPSAGPRRAIMPVPVEIARPSRPWRAALTMAIYYARKCRG